MIAWLIARYVIGHEAPFFAPASAIIVLGQAKGMRTRRAIEVMLGVAGGILLADIVAQLIDNTSVTVIVLIVLTLSITTAAGASSILVVPGDGVRAVRRGHRPAGASRWCRCGSSTRWSAARSR